MKHLHPPFVLFIALLLLMVIPLSPPASAAKSDQIKSDKVDVCHLPESTSDNRHIINISTNGNALNAHLSHGDWEATAEKCDAIPDNDCDSEPDPVADDADCVAINGGPGWTCQIGVCNSPPTDIALDSADIDENLASGTPVGTLSSTDPDSPGPFTYTLVSGDGDSDNAAFSVSGSQLLSAASFNFESKNSYNARLMTDAGDGGTYQEAITISVNDINEAPTAIVLENDSIHENQAAGTLISYFTTSDVDAGDSHAYTLVAGPVDTDNASFDIVDDQLVSAESFDFEARDSYSVRVQSEDSGGLTVAQSYLITIIDVNDPPTAIALDKAEIDEEQAVGTPVGTFSSTDVDSASFEYSLVSGIGDADNASFTIVDDQLKSAAIFNYDEQNIFNIRVQTDDGDGGTFQETFTVTVLSICGDNCFPNGVAAGDVDQTSVVLWTRASYTGKVRFEYGTDPDFVLAYDGFEEVPVDTDTYPDGSIYYIPSKVPITGLLAGTQYYYRACRDSCPQAVDPVSEARGSFRTPFADGKRGLRFGVSSCWKEDSKPFVGMKNVPDRDLDFFVALGDTAYADGSAGPGQAMDLFAFRDKHEKSYSQVTRPDDNFFALARASTAFYVDIDDHEVVDNFVGGAPPLSHSESLSCRVVLQGDDPFLKGRCLSICNPEDDPQGNCERQYTNETELYKDALEAWHEYNPIDEDQYGVTGDPLTEGKSKLYRYRTFGKDAAIFMLDTRSFRSELTAVIGGLSDTMLGAKQLQDLKDDLRKAEDADITWKVVLVPEPIQNIGPIASRDRFEGYVNERGEILQYIESECIKNVVFISGDIHGTIANNLVYERIRLGPKRYSSSWDISTGPAGYDSPFGPAIIEKMPEIVANFPGITNVSEEEYNALSRIGKDSVIKDIMDHILYVTNNPLTGFYDEDPIFPVLQPWNERTSARLLQGSYVATNTFGWTEFEIDVATQKLLVTTYGVDWYGDDEEVSSYIDKVPIIVSQFEVSPTTACPGTCGDGFCADTVLSGLSEKCGGNDSTLLQCTSDCGKCGNGQVCGDSNMCQSGLCNLGFCMDKQPDGNLCGGDFACISGICNLGACTSPRPNGESCASNRLCESGICNLGFCMDKQPDGNLCGGDYACRSGLCNLGGCTSPRPNGEFCTSDRLCISGNCRFSLCRAP